MKTFTKTYELPPDVVRLLQRDCARTQDVGHTLNHVQLSDLTVIALGKTLGGLRVEYAILFTWRANEVQPIHVDGTPPGAPRHASLNLLIKGGEGANFEWYDAEIEEEPMISKAGIKAFKIKEETATLIHREPLHACSVVLTSMPHRVANITTDTHLLCIRMQGNPSISQF